CNGLEPCMNCDDAKIVCTYNTLSPGKKKAHDAYVLAKSLEQSRRLKSAEIIITRFGNLDIAGTNTNFGPILSQVINLPRYEPPPSNFNDDNERILSIGGTEKRLIDCYFNHFNYYIPILNRKTFMEQVMDPEQLNTVVVQKLLVCVLATGFAFRQEIGDTDIINKMEPRYGTGMIRKFHHFNAQDVFNSTIENCQCYLVLTGFYSSITNYDAVHNLVALAHSVAASQGLNRTKGLYYQFRGEREHTPETVELGHRIFWSVVIVCSGYSLSHQSPFITSNDYDIPFPKRQPSDIHKDFQGVSQDDFAGIKDLCHFVPMYEISSRIADITCTATRQRPHTKVDEARAMLQDWRTKTLPEELRITPFDMDAIKRQTRFSKFYHAVSYMFEICLHHTFQLHESHRALGVHGMWSSYCYDAAIGIKNIYLTRPMTRMNSHVVLPVAAGAFANIVSSKVLGKEQDAQKYCDDIKRMMSEIVRASSSVERDQLVKYVPHGYNGVTMNADGQVDPFNINAPETPPWNERSPSHTTGSSPDQATDVTVDTDEGSSEEEGEEEDTSEGEDGQAQRMTQQPNTAIYSSNQQPLDQQQSNYTVQGYNDILHNPTSGGTYTETVVSYTDTNGNGIPYSNQQQQHRDSIAGSFTNDGAKMSADSGFASSHGQGVDQDTYFVQRQQNATANPCNQQHQSFSAGQPLDGGNVGATRQHQGSVSSVVSSSSASGFYSDNATGIEGITDEQIAALAGRGLWPQNPNEAQLAKLSEYITIVTTTKMTNQQRHNLDVKLQQQLNLLASAASSSSSAPHGGFTTESYGDLDNSQYLLHQHSSYEATPITLSGSQLLSGVFDGASSVQNSIFSDVFVQDQRFYQPAMMAPMSGSVNNSTYNKSFTGSSDLSSPISPTSQQQQQQQQQQQHQHQQHQNMAISNQNGNMMMYQQQQQQQQQHGQALSMNSMAGYADIMRGIGQEGSGDLTGLDGDMSMGIPSDLSVFYSTNVVADSGFAFDDLESFNDPQMVKMQQLFSSFASRGQQQARNT
ncbi:hypothetical protein BGZ49_003769, partial [Haplosporangium sp. Z 27]